MTSAPPSDPTLRRPIWPILVLCAAAFAAYHNSFHGPFVFDDASSIVTNPTLRRLWPLPGPLAPPTTNVTAQGRPLLNLSLAINYAIGGTAVEGYHVFNLLVHALAGLTLFGLVRRAWRWLRQPPGGPDNRTESEATWSALVVALLWTVHPLQTESVTYIVQRAESLMGLFYLLTLYCFIRAIDGKPWGLGFEGHGEPSREKQTVHPIPTQVAGNPHVSWLGLSALACFAGMATKEVMATAPLVVLLFDRTFVAGSFGDALRTRTWFYVALFSSWLLLAWLIVQTGGNRGGSVGFGVDAAWWDYWLTQFKAIAHYLRLSFWPSPLVFEYGSFSVARVGDVAVDAVVVMALLVSTLRGLWRRSGFGFLGACFFGILAPTSLAPGTTQMIVEHRMYLPLAAVIVTVVAAVRTLSATRAVWTSVVFASLAGIALLLTIRRNEDYRSDVVLWSDTVVKAPRNPLAHFMLAGAYERAGDVARAGENYEETLRLKPNFSIGHENFGELLLRQSRLNEAIVQFEAALRLQPALGDAHMNLGNALVAQHRVAESLPHLAEAVRLAPDVAETHYNLANALSIAERSDDAKAEFEAALAHPAGTPDVHMAAHYQLGNALAISGKPADAVAHYEAVLRARPGFAEAHHNLGSALFELGRLSEAAQQYAETLRLSPNFPGARENLARVQKQIGAR